MDKLHFYIGQLEDALDLPKADRRRTAVVEEAARALISVWDAETGPSEV